MQKTILRLSFTIKHISLFCSLLFCLSVHAQTFQNPIRNSAPDPTMAYYNGYYYLTYTNGSQLDMVKSATVGGLKTAPAVTVWTDPNPSRCCHMWAPALRLLNGPNGLRWYLYYCADDGNDVNHRNYVLESAGLDPMGPYTFKNKLIPTSGDEKGIDGNVLVKDDGSLYFIWCFNSRIAIATMSNPWTVTSNKVIISVPTLTWEKQMAAVNENPAILKRAGKTFLTYSASHCASPGYAMGMLTNTDGNYMNAASWIKSANPVFQSHAGNGVYGTGGNDFFKSPDGLEDWFVYHATSNPNGDCGGGRSSRIQKVSWNANNTPNFGVPLSEATSILVPSASVNLPYGVYRIKNPASGRVLDAEGCSGNNSSRTIIYDWYGADCQRWLFEPLGDGYYKIVCRMGGKVLDNINCLGTDANGIQLWDWLNNDCQRWRIIDWGGGNFGIVNKASGKVLDVANGGTANGTQVWQYGGHGGPAQRWLLEEVSSNYIAEGLYRIKLERTGKVLTPANGLDQRGSITTQSDWLDSNYQKWQVTATADGWYKVNSAKGSALDVDVCNTVNGGKVMLWDWLDNNCQRWGFSTVPGGKWAIVSRNSAKVLDAPGSLNGDVVYQWTWANNANQIWLAEPTTLTGAANSPNRSASVFIAPNPVNAGTDIQVNYLSEIDQPAAITVYDILGRPVQTTSVQAHSGLNRFLIKTTTLQRGIYIVTLQSLNNQSKVNKKIIVR